MRALIAAASAACCLLMPATAGATARGPAPDTGWRPYDAPVTTRTVIPHHRHHHHHAGAHDLAAPPPSKLGRLADELAAVRRELAEVRAQVGRSSPPPWDVPAISWLRQQQPAAEPQRLASLPDLSGPLLMPGEPERLPAPFWRSPDAVLESRAYLLRTATPGSTMSRQGPEVAIARLHPAFAVKLAQAVRVARQAGLDHAGIYSAYRPPVFGVGGFKDKFRSLHSYGLAIDAAGIGRPGSAAARLWAGIVRAAGLFLPYGPNNRAEWNHTQMIAAKIAPADLRPTITASAPKDLRKMWLASGIRDEVPPTFAAAARSAHAEAALAMLDHHTRNRP